MVKKSGSGIGRIFRAFGWTMSGLKAAFLQEAARITGNDKLKELSFEMTTIGDMWREFAIITGRIVKNRNKADESYNHAADLLLAIADKEETFYKKLQQSIS